MTIKIELHRYKMSFCITFKVLAIELRILEYVQELQSLTRKFFEVL